MEQPTDMSKAISMEMAMLLLRVFMLGSIERVGACKPVMTKTSNHPGALRLSIIAGIPVVVSRARSRLTKIVNFPHRRLSFWLASGGWLELRGVVTVNPAPRQASAVQFSAIASTPMAERCGAALSCAIIFGYNMPRLRLPTSWVMSSAGWPFNACKGTP